MKHVLWLAGCFCLIGMLAVLPCFGQEKADEIIQGPNPWYDRIQISGLVEIEAGLFETDYEDNDVEDEKGNDVDLAKVELAVDAAITRYVDAHVLFLYEDDEITVDEGFITLSGPESFPAYLIAGRQYIPFGNFDSHFVTDPTPLTLGETNEGALVAGYRFGGEMIDISAGAFNSDVQEAGDDDTVNGFVAGISFNPFEGLRLGASYTSNLAASDALKEFIVDPENLESLVAAFGVYVTYEFSDRFKLIGEYITALDDFAQGEIYDISDPLARSPRTYNIEFGFKVLENLELAVRYAGADDGGAEFLPESEYGAVVNWGLFENTNLAVEYLHGEFEDDVKTTDTAVIQLAVEF
ncbi:MAG: LbtU family siderophore porin [Deltaproteobacteria bacterium]|nr:LbtU family siderophore porin [Deltaproteobacteria bacterium]MBW2042098.1 LbtU family siderophore porin [Deltaproteobacteria bacterium]MBW2132591.1 LbtU family siderophore porin [Deltaproteobacteria bacterium]